MSTATLGAHGAVLTAALALRAWRWAGRGLERLSAQRQPRNAQELLAYARSIENTMPNLAAEMRYLVGNALSETRSSPSVPAAPLEAALVRSSGRSHR